MFCYIFVLILFCYLFFKFMKSSKIIIKLIPLKYSNNKSFRIGVFRVVGNRVSFFLESLGFFFNSFNIRKFYLNSMRLGFWLNRGALLKMSVIKLLAKFIYK